MKVKFKKIHEIAQIPQKANPGDAGFDLVATSIEHPFGAASPYIEAGTALAVEIPRGYVGLVFPRSSISDTKHFLRNSVGVIDSGYRGEIKLRFSIDESLTAYKIGDRVGQIIFIKLPAVEIIEAATLGTSTRQQKGFGSSGK